MPRRWLPALLALLLPTDALLAQPPAEPPRTRKVVLIAGRLDPNHPKGTHEYEKSVRLLRHCLETSPNLRGVAVEVHYDGWPRDEAVLDGADTIVLVSSGSD